MDHTVGKQNGWRERLMPVHNENTGGGTGLCLEIRDLAVSKLIAGREKDIDFLTGLLRHCLVRLPILRDRLALPEGSARVSCQGYAVICSLAGRLGVKGS
jgi:hypothetical protein